MREAMKILKLIVIAFLVLALAYPFLFLLEGRWVGNRAAGDLVRRDGRVVGAHRIGQAFSSEMFFQGRPSAAGETAESLASGGEGYDAMSSGGSNLGPTNLDLAGLVRQRIAALLAANPGLVASDIPVDLVTASASGLDPEISEQGALIQVPRVAAATGIPAAELRDMIEARIRGRWLGIFGEPGVNVLDLNIAVLDKMKEVGK